MGLCAGCWHPDYADNSKNESILSYNNLLFNGNLSFMLLAVKPKQGEI